MTIAQWLREFFFCKEKKRLRSLEKSVVCISQRHHIIISRGHVRSADCKRGNYNKICKEK